MHFYLLRLQGKRPHFITHTRHTRRRNKKMKNERFGMDLRVFVMLYIQTEKCNTSPNMKLIKPPEPSNNPDTHLQRYKNCEHKAHRAAQPDLMVIT